MPFLRVLVDDVDVATLDTQDREMAAVHAGGTRVDDDYADLSVSGGVYDPDVGVDHRIWVNQLPLKIGQTVTVALLENAIATGEGRTVDELYPGQHSEVSGTAASRSELAEEIRRLPQLRDGYTVRVTWDDKSPITFTTSPDEHGFLFSILWHSRHPNRMSVSLHAYTIDSIEAEASGRTSFGEKVNLGSHVRLELVA